MSARGWFCKAEQVHMWLMPSSMALDNARAYKAQDGGQSGKHEGGGRTVVAFRGLPDV